MNTYIIENNTKIRSSYEVFIRIIAPLLPAVLLTVIIAVVKLYAYAEELVIMRAAIAR